MSSSRENTTKFDLQEAKEFIKDIIDTNRKNAKKGIKKKIAFELIGDAGIGKTSAILQVADEMSLDLVKLNLAQIEEIGDIVGFPLKKYFIEKEINGEMQYKTVTEKQLNAWYRNGWQPQDKDPVMSYAPPEWIVNRSQSGILLLDDWSRGDVRFIQCMMELIDRGEYISWTLPPDWHVILSSNPDNGEYLVNSLDEAQSTRFMTGGIKYDEKIWAEWAENNHIDPRCINFMLLNPEAVTGVKDKKGHQTKSCANPRQWVNFFHTIGNVQNFKASDEIRRIETVGQMAVGSDLISMFISFINGNMDKLLPPEYIILNPDYDKVKAKIKDCIGEGNKYRNDIASVQCIRLANWLIKYSKDNPIDEQITERMLKLITGETFGADLSYTLAKRLHSGNRNKFVKLVSKKSFLDYIIVTK